MLKKLKKVIIAINTFFLMLPAKLSGSYTMGVSIYGVSKPETIEPEPETDIWTILKIIFIPIILLIGCIVFITKSKSSKKTKIVIGILLIILAIVFLNVSYNYLLN